MGYNRMDRTNTPDRFNSTFGSYSNRYPNAYHQLHNGQWADRNQVFNNAFGEKMNDNRMSYRSTYNRQSTLSSSSSMSQSLKGLASYNPLAHFFRDNGDLKGKIALLIYFMVGLLATMFMFGRGVYKKFKVFHVVRNFINQYVLGKPAVDGDGEEVSGEKTPLPPLVSSVLSKYEDEYYEFYQQYLERQKKKKEQVQRHKLSSSVEKYCEQWKKEDDYSSEEVNEEDS